MVFFLVFLVIQFLITGYHDSQRSETLTLRENERKNYEREIAELATRVRWGDTAAARVYLKKLHGNVRLPGEKMIVLVPKQLEDYSVDTAIDDANRTEEERIELTIPQKWNQILLKKRSF